MLVRIANWEDPDQTRSSLIWVCTVCLALFGRQLVLNFLGHLPYISKFPSFGAYNILNLMLENLTLFHLSNKGTDQIAFPIRHISVFVNHYLESMLVQHAPCKFQQTTVKPV